MNLLRRFLQHTWGTDAPSAFTPARALALWSVWLASLALCLNLSTAQFALLFSALLLTLDSLLRPAELGPLLRPLRPLLGAYGLLLAALGLSLIATPVGFGGLAFIDRGRAWLAPLPLALALRHAGPRARRVALWCLLLGAALAGTLGVVQFFTGAHPGAELLGVPPSRWQIRSPVDPERFAAVGFFYNRTRFAHVMVVPVCLGLAAFVTQPGRRSRFALTALLAPILAGFVLTYTRAALIAVSVAALIVLALLSYRSLRRLGPGLLAALAAALPALMMVALLLMPSLRTRLASSIDVAANSDRLFLWQQAARLIADFGATGIGFAQHGLIRSAYHDAVDPFFAMRAQDHNLYLSLLVEMGPLGLLAWLLLLVTALRRACRLLQKNSDDRDLLAGTSAALLAFGLLSLFHDPPYQAVEALAFFWPLALIASVRLPSESAARLPTPSALAPLPASWRTLVGATLAAVMLSLRSPPALVLTGLLLLGGLLLSPLQAWARRGLRLLLALGLAMLCFALPPWGLASLLLLVIFAWPDLSADLRLATLLGSVALSVPLGLVAWTGGAATGLRLLQSSAALVLVAAALDAPWGLPVRPTRTLVGALTALVALGLLLRWSSWDPPAALGAQRQRQGWTQGVLAGQGDRVEEALLHRACAQLGQGQRRQALSTLRWAGVLRPAVFLSPEAVLWQAELSLDRDRRIAERVASRVQARYGDRRLVQACTVRDARLVEALCAWAQRSRQKDLRVALERVLARGSVPRGLNCRAAAPDSPKPEPSDLETGPAR